LTNFLAIDLFPSAVHIDSGYRTVLMDESFVSGNLDDNSDGFGRFYEKYLPLDRTIHDPKAFS